MCQTLLETIPGRGMVEECQVAIPSREVAMILGKIERLKLLLSLALQASLMEFIETTCDELVTAGRNIEDIKAVISSLEINQRAHTKKIEEVQGNLTHLGTRLYDAANDVTDIRNTVDRNQEGQERQDVLNWLSAPEFDQKHAVAFGKHAAGTGEWFLRHTRFMAWQQGDYNALWCPGNPGVGKSVMA
ncbi:hypothetical protein BD779DRAFT_1210700 [Infundibulicybe gibba]|nr:hypothetical protein BD779DRAFT_1210700 [Infundibulicybe gibba]